jgi:ribulose-phosphate 3-epimerase
LPERVRVQVDGGIDHETIAAAHAAGATLLVAGSAIFGGDDLTGSYRRLLQALA